MILRAFLVVLTLAGVMASIIGYENVAHRKPRFPREIYRAIEQETSLTLTSPTFVEIAQGGVKIGGRYFRDARRLGVMLPKPGGMETIYFKITPQGLQDEQGLLLYAEGARREEINRRLGRTER